MSGYVLYRRGDRWHLTVYTDGRIAWTQVYTSGVRARAAAWWLRVRGIRQM